MPPEPDEYGDFPELTPERGRGDRDAAADELLAVGAASTGRRGPGQRGSARVFPGESSSPAAAFGPGMVFDVLPGCAQLAVAADGAVGRRPVRRRVRGRAGGVLCAWDRVQAHAAARKLAVVAELAGEPSPGGRGVHRGPDRERPRRIPRPRYELMGTAGHLDTHLPGTKAALFDGR